MNYNIKLLKSKKILKLLKIMKLISIIINNNGK